MSPGPKPKTPRNAPRRAVAGEVTFEPAPTSPLNATALEEFWRLVMELDRRGTLDRIDVATITECARVKGMLDGLHEAAAEFPIPPRGMVAQIGILESQRRGRLRELGLTTMPHRSILKTIVKDTSESDPTKAKIKLHGER